MSRRLRAYLVDDEPLALERLAEVLEETGRVEVVGSTTDPEAALAALGTLEVDVAFLDIRMPGMTGLELARRLPADQLVAFTTGYDQYAVEAFEVNAIDYVLKPVERERLERTLDRLERRRDDPSRGELRGVMERLASYLARGRPAPAERISVRAADGAEVIDLAGISHFVADGKQTRAITARGVHLVDQMVGDLERKLDAAKFVRIHRGALVNLAWIDEVRPWFGGRLRVRLKDPKRTELVVARDRVRAVRERLGL